MIPDLEFRKKTTYVKRWACRLRSDLSRTTQRSARARQWRDYHGTRRPRYDEEIVIAWARRKLGDQAVEIRRPEVSYQADDYGSGAAWFGILDCLVPENDAERAIFTGLRLDPGLNTFSFFEVVK